MKQNSQPPLRLLLDSLCQGNRKSISRIITILESDKNDHKALTIELLAVLRQKQPRQAIRLGVTGTPGVGKSTFIESLGMHLVSRDLKVAVLAVDPTSHTSGGSILGDKTRMHNLSREASAYIRSSPTGKQHGGITNRTAEAAFICEQAGFDVIIIETTGTGQTDFNVADTVDIFVLLIAPEGGDELQGIKRGIMEVADLILVNKADGPLESSAKKTAAEYEAALRLLQKRIQDPPNFPKINLISAQLEVGIGQAWKDIQNLVQWRKANGIWDLVRNEQEILRFRKELHNQFVQLMSQDKNLAKLQLESEERIRKGLEEPLMAAQQIMQSLNRKSIGHDLDN